MTTFHKSCQRDGGIKATISLDFDSWFIMTILKGTLFRPDSSAPLYQALYTHIRAAILSGELTRGTKLPSTRALAEELNISRNTVLNAYRQLLAEGYLEGKEGSGTFVAHVLPEFLLAAPRPDS